MCSGTDIQDLIEDANGEICAGGLKKTRDGLSGGEYEEWSSGVTPIEYLRSKEQPHYMWIKSGDILKVTSGYNEKLIDSCRVPLSSINKWSNKHGKGKVGYIGNEQPYPNVILITNERLIAFIGEEPKDKILEFDFRETQVTIDLLEGSIFTDGIQYHIIPLKKDASKLHFVLNKSDFTRSSVSIDSGTADEKNTNYKDSDSKRKLSHKVSINHSDRNVSLSKIKALTPQQFEQLVAEVWRSRGYSCTVTDRRGDKGIDVVAKKDDEEVLIQAKRYSDKNVGIDAIQRTAGLLVDNQFDPSKVVIVTTSEYTSDAVDRAEQIDSLSIINGFELVSLFAEA